MSIFVSESMMVTVTGRSESWRRATNFGMDDAGWPPKEIESRDGNTSATTSGKTSFNNCQ